MLLSMTGCGGSAEPAETTPATTEPVAQVTEAPTEEPTVAPTEDPYAYTVYDLSAPDTYEGIVWSRGFWEVDLNECVLDAEANGASGAQAIPLSLELSQMGFRMTVDYKGYDVMSDKVISAGTVEIIGAKADGLANIAGVNIANFKRADDGHYEDANGNITPFLTTANGQMLSDIYAYYNLDSAGYACDIVEVLAFYYPLTGNLYNIVYKIPSARKTVPEPRLVTFLNEVRSYPPFRSTVQTLSYGDFTYEMSQFAIQCGSERYVYSYRPGMSLSDWACSELNTDGWIPWYGDEILSPDRKYSCNTGYLDMQGQMDFNGCGKLIIAEEYDGKTNYISNDGNMVETSGVDLGGLDLSGGGAVSIISGDQMAEFMAQNGLNSIEEVEDFLKQNGTGGLSMGTISPNESGEISTEDLLAAGATEENEIAAKGNISVSVAHMVNAHTPLFTPGFRIVSKEGGLSAYHSVEMSYDLLLDDILYIYMNGIADELIPHIKLYAFPESEEFMATLEGHTILNVHPTPLEQGNEMLTIPEDALCLTFQRVTDGQEAPGSPTPRKPGHENLNKDAVYTRYATTEDPNFSEGVNLVFAITFDDELVYWIHMGANFNEYNTTQWVSSALPY